MSWAMEFSSPVLGQSIMAPHVGVVTYRYTDGCGGRQEVLAPRRREYVSTISRPVTRQGPAPGLVSTHSEDSVSPDGRPSHFSSTVYRSPYGKTYRFNSHF